MIEGILLCFLQQIYSNLRFLVFLHACFIVCSFFERNVSEFLHGVTQI